MIKFFKDNTNESSMRLALLLLTYATVLILIALSIYIVVMAVNKLEITRWTDMGIFATGLGTIVTGIAWNKVQQKKIETNKTL